MCCGSSLRVVTYRSLARNRDFTALWVGQTVSELGTAVSIFVFPLVTYALTGSVLLAGAVEAAHLLGFVGALLPAGVLADRVDRRRLMRLSSGVGILLYGALAVAGATGTLTLPHLMATALLTGLAAGLFGPAETSAVRSVVRPEDLPTAMSQNQARRHVASLVGGPLGGALYGVARWLPFAGDAVSYAISWFLIGRIRTDLSATRRAEPAPWRRDLAVGVRYVADRPLFRTLAVWSALSNLTINALFTVATLRLIEAGFDPVAIGLVDAVAGGCGIFGAIAAPWLIRRVPTGRLSVVVAWSFVPLLAPMMLWNHPLAVCAALGAGLFLNPAGNAGIGSYRMSITPADLQGRVQSATYFLAMCTMPLAPLLGGGLLAWLGGVPALGCLTVLVAAVALIPTMSRPIRSVPRPENWPVDEPTVTRRTGPAVTA